MIISVDDCKVKIMKIFWNLQGILKAIFAGICVFNHFKDLRWPDYVIL